MNPDKTAQLQHHLDAIAQLLYEESDPTTMQTLEGIELTLREKIKTHVSPALGSFLSNPSPTQQQGENEP